MIRIMRKPWRLSDFWHDENSGSRLGPPGRDYARPPKEQREKEQARRRHEEQEETRRQQDRANERRAKSNGAIAQDWWAVLGTAPDATLEIAKQAYRLKVKQYHPDRVAGLGPEIVQLAEQRSKELNAALEQARLYART
jgi:DnaJ-domain-containing protein 1